MDGPPFAAIVVAKLEPTGAVPAENRVGGDDRQFFLKRLGNQQPIKGIAMMRVECFGAPDMRHLDVQHPQAVGSDLLEAVGADPGGFDLVVTDYDMPGMSGLDVARGVRALMFKADAGRQRFSAAVSRE